MKKTKTPSVFSTIKFSLFSDNPIGTFLLKKTPIGMKAINMIIKMNILYFYRLKNGCFDITNLPNSGKATCRYDRSEK